MPRAARSLDILVVGAGLGGLAAGLALQTDGHKVQIIDAAPEFAEVGRLSHYPYVQSIGNMRLMFLRLVRVLEYPLTQADYYCAGVSIWKI